MEHDKTEEMVMSLLPSQSLECLVGICETLELDKSKVASKKGNKNLILKMIVRYLSSETLEDSEDGGFSTFLKIYDIIKPNIESEFNITSTKKIKDENKTFFKSELKSDSNLPIPQNLSLKEFKILGKIGHAGQKERLTFTSLNYQIENGIKKGYTDIEITSAVIASLSPDLELRGYLEGKSDLSLPSLRKILRNHFKELDSSHLFNLLNNAKQSNSESPNDFVIRLMNLRQKLIYVSKEDPYLFDERLVQSKFLQAIFTGLRNENLRHELRPLLKNPKTSDEELLESLSLAMIDENEHLEKTSKKVHVNLIEQNEQISEEQENKSKKENLLIKELQNLRAEVNQLSTIHNDFKTFNANIKNKGNPQRQNKCKECIDKNVQKCEHCLVCGSAEHFKAGCKLKYIMKSTKN